ncbi:MAG: PBSX family phage terminase large subunit [Methylococcales bacterium]
MKLQIQTAKIFEPLFAPYRYKGAYGGRGSGKSHFFAALLIRESLLRPPIRAVCIREYQSTLRDSSKRLIEDLLDLYRLGESQGFRSLVDRIETPKGGLITFRGMQDTTAESLKSLEGIDIAWIEEAQVLSQRSLSLLRPTIRADKSELWFSWNPRRAEDPVDRLLRTTTPTNACVIRSLWSDNPWFPPILDQERQDCLRSDPSQYDHIWTGDYVTVADGAYFAQALASARAEHRIGHVAPEPLMPYHAFWDIGGTGTHSDACAIWIAQFVGREIRVLDYYEAIGQPLAEHVAWLRNQKYDQAHMHLPHDGVTHDRVFDVTFEGQLRKANFPVSVTKNQGAGAAIARIEAIRRIMPSCRFAAEPCKGGLEALGWYHERKSESRSIGLGPEHDWSSHGADAFGLLAIGAEDLFNQQGRRGTVQRNDMRIRWNQSGAWME